MDSEIPNLRHLRICLKVAETQSVSAASKQVYLSQPAISQAISKLEKLLGVALFDRRPNGMFPTGSGKLYFERTERALDLLKKGASLAIRAKSDKGAGRSTDRQNKNQEHFYRFFTAAQLRALIAVSRSNNFTIAAHNVGISQPTLHRAAHDLEKLSGLALFKAYRRGVKLTEPAKILVRYAMLAAAELRHAFNEIQENFTDKPGRTTRIYVGALPLARSNILPNSIRKLIADQKNVQIQVIDGPYDGQLKKLRHGDIDFIIGALREPDFASDVVQETLFEDTLAVVVRKGHPLTRQSNIEIDKLLQFDWIAPARNTPTGDYLFRKLGIGEMYATPVKVVSSSLILIRSLLLSSDCVTIISTHQIEEELKQGTLVCIPMDMSDSEREIGLAYRQGWYPTPLQTQLLNIIRSASAEF